MLRRAQEVQEDYDEKRDLFYEASREFSRVKENQENEAKRLKTQLDNTKVVNCLGDPRYTSNRREVRVVASELTASIQDPSQYDPAKITACIRELLSIYQGKLQSWKRRRVSTCL